MAKEAGMVIGKNTFGIPLKSCEFDADSVWRAKDLLFTDLPPAHAYVNGANGEGGAAQPMKEGLLIQFEIKPVPTSRRKAISRRLSSAELESHACQRASSTSKVVRSVSSRVVLTNSCCTASVRKLMSFP